MRTTADLRRELAEEALDRTRRPGLAPVLALVSGVLACGQPAPVPDREVVRMDEGEREAYEETIAELRGDLEEEVSRRLAAEGAVEAAHLQGSSAALEARLAECRADLERYRVGLQRAVDELNRAGARPIILPILVPDPAPVRDHGEVHVFTPRVTRPSGLAVLVEGHLYSTRATRTEATAVIRLMENGRETEVERIPVAIDAGEGTDYSVMFHLTPDMAAIYTAQVEIEDRF